MVALNPLPSPQPDREARFLTLASLLTVNFPHLSDNVADMGPLDLFLINPELRGRNHSIWLVDGEVSDPVEMSGLRHIPKATFALQLEIIPLSAGERPFFGWNLLKLNVLGDFNPGGIVREIESFGRGYDACLFAHFLATKVNNPHSFDPRVAQPTSLEEYFGVLDRIQGRSLVISTKRQVGEFEQFVKGI